MVCCHDWYCTAQAETGKHSRALNQEWTHLKRLSLGEQQITQRLDHRYANGCLCCPTRGLCRMFPVLRVCPHTCLHPSSGSSALPSMQKQ